MFARVLTGSHFKKKVTAKFLADSGNLGRSLISEKLATSLKLQVHPCKHSIKSAQGSKVTILGETNPMVFMIEGQRRAFKWKFLVIRDLCAPGVFGIDFFNHFSVGIQMSPSGKNHLTFGKNHDQIVPLVSPNAPNLPDAQQGDKRFVGAHIFRQKSKSSQTAAALQEEVGKQSSGLAPGRPPDASTTTRGAGYPTPGGGGVQPTEHDPGKGEGGDKGGNPPATELTSESDTAGTVVLKPSQRTKIKPHYRTWVQCRAPEEMQPSMAVLVDEDGLKGGPGRKHGVKVVEAIDYMRNGKVAVLVENNSDQIIQLGPSYVLAEAHPMIEPEVDWARGHYSIDQVCFILQQEKEAEGREAWPTDEELKSRGPNSWWDPCKGMIESQRMVWVEEAFNLEKNEYLKKNPQWRLPYLQALARYTDCVAGKGHVEAIPETTWVSMSLDTLPGARPIHQRPRPLSPPDQADLDRQLAIWLRQRVIVPAVKGAWALNLVPVRKKGVAAGVRRWTLDARGINNICESHPEYIGSVGSNLEELAGVDLYCQLDLSNAFLSIPIHPDHIHKASFVTPKSGSFSMTRSGYGFKNSPAALEKLGTALMRPIPAEKGNKYMDDFLLKDCHPGELLKTLCTFLDQIRAANVKIQASKCNILATRVVFLGHLVVGGLDETKEAGLYPDPELLSTILGTPEPDCAASLKRYLGQLAFYSQFIVGISAVTASLHQAKNRVPFKLDDKEKSDFKKSLQMMADSPALSFPDFSDLKARPFILAGDFSPVACSASLHQYQRGGLRLLGAAGRSNKGAAQRWASMRGEAASVKLGLDKWRHILLRFWFPAITDNLSLTHARNMKDPTGFWARFLEYISQFNMSFIHRSGIDGPVEDAWSRMTHHPAWSAQEKLSLADYEDDADEQRGPGVPDKIPIGLRELLVQKSVGLDKPWEVQGASHLDPAKPDKEGQLATMMSKCSLTDQQITDYVTLQKKSPYALYYGENEGALRRAMEELNRRSPETAQSIMAMATKSPPKEQKPDPWGDLAGEAAEEGKKIAFFSDYEEDYYFPESGDENEANDEEASSEYSEEEEEESEEETEAAAGAKPDREVPIYFRRLEAWQDALNKRLNEDLQRTKKGLPPDPSPLDLPDVKENEYDKRIKKVVERINKEQASKLLDPKGNEEAEVDEDHYVNLIRPEFRTVRAIQCKLTQQQKAMRQRVNPIIREVMRWVSEKKKPEPAQLRGKPKDLQAYANVFELLRLVDGVLYMDSLPEPGGENEETDAKWCVPANSVADILDIAHIEDAKHMATQSTLARLNKVAFWPSMKQDAEDFCLACPGCRPKHQAPKGHLLALHKPRLQSRVNQCWYLDLVGPLNETTNGLKHIFTCLDGFSRYVSAIPIKDKRAETIIACLKAVVNIWGIPEEVFCDHGKELDNQQMRQVAAKMGIRQYFAISYEARTNKVERYHRVQSALLRSVLAEVNDYENWHKYVPDVTRAYNTSVHSVTKFTPHRLQTGKEFSGPLRTWVGPPEERDALTPEDRERSRVRQRTLDELKATSNQWTYQRRQTGLYQSKPTFKPEVGQKVFVYLPVAIKANNQTGFIARKLSSGWCGPWKVQKMITDQICRVAPMDGDPKQVRTVSVDRMEPYREGYRYDSATTARPLPPEHPLVKRANADVFVEDIFHPETTDKEASNPWWPWSTAEVDDSLVPAMPPPPRADPDHEALDAIPMAVPADEILRTDAESGQNETERAASMPAPSAEAGHLLPARGRETGARPKWKPRVRFREPIEEGRGRSPSNTEERRMRREAEVMTRRRGLSQDKEEEKEEMVELKPNSSGPTSGGGEDKGKEEEASSPF